MTIGLVVHSTDALAATVSDSEFVIHLANDVNVLTRTDDGSVEMTNVKSGTLDRFNPALGALTGATLSWNFLSSVQYGVFAYGPDFLPGAGTVDGRVSLELSSDMPIPSPILDSQLLEGSRTGSISGEQNTGAIDSFTFNKTGQFNTTDLGELQNFVGTTPIQFSLALYGHADVDVSVPGPQFGLRFFGPGVFLLVKYTYVPVQSRAGE